MNYNINKTSNLDDEKLVKLEAKRAEFSKWNIASKKFIYFLIFQSMFFGILITQINTYTQRLITGGGVMLYLIIMIYFIWKRDKIIFMMTRLQLEQEIKEEMIKTGRKVE